jgi:hypothetical protein
VTQRQQCHRQMGQRLTTRQQVAVRQRLALGQSNLRTARRHKANRQQKVQVLCVEAPQASTLCIQLLVSSTMSIVRRLATEELTL